MTAQRWQRRIALAITATLAMALGVGVVPARAAAKPRVNALAPATPQKRAATLRHANVARKQREERAKTRLQAESALRIIQRAHRNGKGVMGKNSIARSSTANVVFSQTTGLASGQTLQVTGTGLTPANYLFIVECAVDAGNGFTDCDLNEYTPNWIDSLGTVTTTKSASRHITLSGNVYDCGAAANLCFFSWLDLGSGATADLPLSFDPNAGSVLTAKVTPANNLVHFQTVTIDGNLAGLANGYVQIAQCPTGAGVGSCVNTANGYADTDAQGIFTTSMNVRRLIGASSQTVDCVVSGACEIVVSSGRSLDLIVRIPISFDPNGPLPEPVTLTISPAGALLDRQPVVLTGKGFTPNAYVDISRCGTPAGGQIECGDFGAGSSGTDQNGQFTFSDTALRLYATYNSGVLDCAVDACSYFATSYDGFSASVNIMFDASVPPPPLPSMTVTPSTGLHNAQTITLQGANWGSNYIALNECAAAINCVRSYADVQVLANGTFVTTISVARLLSNYDGTYTDCADPVAQCTINAYDYYSGFQASAPVTFKGGPISLPTARLQSNRALHDGRSANVLGDHWFPGDAIYAQQCIGDLAGQQLSCGYSRAQPQKVSADGTILVAFTPRRQLIQRICGPNGCPGQTPLDCLDPQYQCTVEVSDNSGGYISLPVHFDRGAPLAAPPTLTATPTTKLHDGQVIELRGSGFDALSSVYTEICQRASLPTACRRGAVLYADREGRIGVPYTVRRVMQSTTDRVVCGTNAVECDLVTSGYFGPLPSSPIPLSFDSGSPLLVPSVSVTPSTNLTNGQVVEISGSGFSANASLVVIECAAGSIGAANCDVAHYARPDADANGMVTTTFPVASSFVLKDGTTIDCAASAAACFLAVADLSDFANANSVPLTFAAATPSAPVQHHRFRNRRRLIRSITANIPRPTHGQ